MSIDLGVDLTGHATTQVRSVAPGTMDISMAPGSWESDEARTGASVWVTVVRTVRET